MIYSRFIWSLKLFHISYLSLATFVITALFLISNEVIAVTCSNPKEVCVEGKATRSFNGVDVTLPCWRYETTLECHEDSDNNCKTLRDQNCSQISAKCLKTFGGTCAVQEETYDCPVKESSTAKGITIGGEFFCISGDCSAVNPKSNKNFGKVAAYGAVLTAAAEDVKQQNAKTPRIFTGKALECSRNIANAKNCCADCGWAKGLLGGCDNDEVELAKAKEQGLAIEAGDGSNNEYCYNRVLKVCTSYHRVYCVFPSKIARIVQVEGRKKQLKIGFGTIGDDDAHPDCRGLTPEELAKLDFTKMDFSALYHDILRKAQSSLPNPKTIGENVQKSIKSKYETATKSSSS